MRSADRHIQGTQHRTSLGGATGVYDSNRRFNILRLLGRIFVCLHHLIQVMEEEMGMTATSTMSLGANKKATQTWWRYVTNRRSILKRLLESYTVAPHGNDSNVYWF